MQGRYRAAVRIVTYRSARGDRAGVRAEAGIHDAADLLGEETLTVRQLLASGRIPDLEERLTEGYAPMPTDGGEVELLPPMPDPDKIICIGLNYRSHAAEAGIEPPETPTFFAKFRNALAPPGAAVELPTASQKLDYEAEVAFVIGRRCAEVDPGEAEGAIAGYMLLNDLSARDLQFATPQWMPGKVFDGSAPCGPALVTPDEAGHHDEISFSLDLNGERMQDGSTSDLVFSAPDLVARLSRWMTLEPGDIVSTGTPSGVGSAREPRVWLKAGDEVVISSPQLGELANTLR
jgi:2-keto-4-pentenoate hydratase/2-oxohepta-3-ene-1,7-dioic acid hydratase in catechol pathway